MYQFKANKWTVEKYGKKSIMEYVLHFVHVIITDISSFNTTVYYFYK